MIPLRIGTFGQRKIVAAPSPSIPSSFSLQQTFYEPTYSNAYHSLALSEDGSLLVVGSSNQNNFTGRVQVFKRTGTSWAQQGANLSGSGVTTNTAFGWYVSISDDGNVIAVSSSPVYPYNTTSHVWFFTFNGTNWVESAKLLDIGSSYTYFGSRHVLNNDGSLCVITAPGAGGSYLYENVSGTWTLRRYFDPVADWGGSGIQSCDISKDGSTIVFGDYSADDYYGSMFVYTKGATTSNWTLQDSKRQSGLSGSFPTLQYFGEGVSISSNGSIITTCAENYTGANGYGDGIIFVYKRNPSTGLYDFQQFVDLEGWYWWTWGVSMDNAGKTVTHSTDSIYRSIYVAEEISGTWQITNLPNINQPWNSGLGSGVTSVISGNGNYICKSYGTEFSIYAR